MSLIPKKGNVYVVDDDEAVRDSLQWLLEGKDYRVRCFDSAESFLSRYDSREVALLSSLIMLIASRIALLYPALKASSPTNILPASSTSLSSLAALA